MLYSQNEHFSTFMSIPFLVIGIFKFAMKNWKKTSEVGCFSKGEEIFITTVAVQTPVKKQNPVKLIYSEKATKFCKSSTVDLSYVVPVRSTVEVSQNCVAFSEYMNCTTRSLLMKDWVLRLGAMAIRVVEFLIGVYGIRKVFA